MYSTRHRHTAKAIINFVHFLYLFRSVEGNLCARALRCAVSIYFRDIEHETLHVGSALLRGLLLVSGPINRTGFFQLHTKLITDSIIWKFSQLNLPQKLQPQIAVIRLSLNLSSFRRRHRYPNLEKNFTRQSAACEICMSFPLLILKKWNANGIYYEANRRPRSTFPANKLRTRTICHTDCAAHRSAKWVDVDAAIGKRLMRERHLSPNLRTKRCIRYAFACY